MEAPTPRIRSTRKLSIAMEVVEQLRDMILLGGLSGGERIDETLLSREFDVSRASLREALNQLAGEGLLEYRPNRGMFVRTYDDKAAADLFVVRAALEPEAARLAAQNATAEDREHLRQTHGELADAARKDDWRATMKLDALLHLAVATASGNSVITRVLRSLRSETHLLVAATGPTIYSSPQNIIDDHEALIDAIERQDSDAAARVAKTHIEQAAARILGESWSDH